MEAAGQDGSRTLTTPEEEALKRNTDCVYFLASPLTCKKGIECEYRHSEGARVNPRDCWFWLNGNCLNLKCQFRHPPLDGLLGTPTTPTGTALPTQAATSMRIPAQYAPATHNSNRQSVPCYYFQKGACLKGDMCPFMHGPPPVTNTAAQQVPKVAKPATEPQPLVKKAPWSIGRHNQMNIPSTATDPPVEVVPSSEKPVAKAEIVPATMALKGNGPLDSELSPKSQTSSVPISSGSAPNKPHSHQSEPIDDRFQNDREADEFLHESSPGFDVLVDDETEDPGYFCDEEEFGVAPGQDGGVNPINDFDLRRTSDNDVAVRFERGQFNEVGGRYLRGHDRYGREHRRASPERIMERSSMSNRRRSQREESPIGIDGSDLRHRLLKQRRLNGSRSAVSPDRRESHKRDGRYAEEHGYRAYNSRKDQGNFPRDGSISKRLQGRITLPGRDTSDNHGGDLHSDRDGRGKSRDRPLIGRPANNQGRLQGRINQRTPEDFALESRNPPAKFSRRDEADSLDFAGPKSLSELRGAKVSENSGFAREQNNMGLRKPLGHQETETHSFEGPKPLSTIIKRKSEVSQGKGVISSYEEENNHQVTDEGPVVGSVAGTASGTQVTHSLVSGKEGNRIYGNPKELEVSVVEEEEEGLIPADEEQQHIKSSPVGEGLVTEDGMMLENIEDDPELEYYEEGDGEYDYELEEGGDDDNAYQEHEEDFNDEDGEGFARKLGAMCS